MKSVSAGGWLWLLRHELRLAWRNIGGKRVWLALIGGGFIWACVHLAAWGLLRGERVLGNTDFQQWLIPAAGAALWLLLSIMVSQTTAHSVSAVFDRGDLDLLLASPLSSRAVFAVRGLAIALAACLLPFLLLIPFAHAGLVSGKPGLLSIYPVMASLALLAAAIGLWLTMTLVRLFGARKAKTISQVLAALIGAAFFLLSQSANFLPREQQAALGAWLKHETQTGGWFAPDSVLWWPVRAMLGEWLPLAVVTIAGVGGFWLVINLTHRRFVSGTQETMVGGTTRTGASAGSGHTTFRRGMVMNLLLKEWKLLARDPQIISQTLLQMLYLIPMLFLGFKSDRSAWLLVPGFVMITSMLAGNLAWLTIAAEDAPELIGTAPVTMNFVRWIKAAAAALPVLALLLPLTLYWLTVDAYAAFVLIFCAGGGMISAALCQIWNPRRGDRRNMKKRYQESRVVSILEGLGSMGWAAIAVCMNNHWIWLPLAMALVLLGPGTAWIVGRDARKAGALA